MGTFARGRDAADPLPRAHRGLVGILSERRYLAQREPAALGAMLRACGARVRLAISGDSRVANLLVGCELVLARGRSPELLDTLRAVEARGVPVINRPAAIASVLDKAGMAEALAAAGVPSPATFAVARGDIAQAAERAGFPAIVKPVNGDNGRGISVLWSSADLSRLTWSESRALVQPYVQSNGRDLKLYVAAGAVWAVEKPTPLGRDPSPARRVALTDEARALAIRCGELFGLELYGVDCLATPAGLSVIEVNDFPNFSEIPEADRRIADLVLASTRGEPRGWRVS
jgi:glutathione synthase/RimK-type ligase-like ATP-grasp enzyme